MVRRIFWMSMFLTVLLTVGVTADWLPGDELHFGKVTASEEVKELAVYALEHTGQKLELEVYLDGDLLCMDSGLRLPGERLKLQDQEQEHTLSEIPVTIHVEKNANKLFPLLFTLQLIPDDRPGLYESTVRLKSVKGPPLEKVIRVWVEVQPWMHLKSEMTTITMNPDLQDGTVRNSFPVILQVRANIPWGLYGFVHGGGLDHVLKLLTTEGDGFQVYPGQILLQDDPVLIATGQPSGVTGVPWSQIPVILEVMNYIELPGGELQFDLYFQVLAQVQSQTSF